MLTRRTAEEMSDPRQRKKQKAENEEKERQKDGLKKFSARESLFSELFEQNRHVRSIFHLAMAAVIVAAADIITRGGGLPCAAAGFSRLPLALALWAVMFCWALLAPVLQPWWRHRPVIYVTWCAAMLFWPAARLEPLGVGCRLAVLTEQLRLLMKVHAYRASGTTTGYRDKVDSGSVTTYSHKGEAVTTYTHKVDNGTVTTYSYLQLLMKVWTTTGYSHYVYFLFAPTLLYRESYPRTIGGIKWKRAAGHLLEVLGSVFVFAYTVERFLAPAFSEYGADSGSLWRTFRAAMAPAGALLVTGHYLLLHAWLNCWAELLRFGDRCFYLDWWCASSFTQYYRRWNVPVHDWLHEHVYIPMHDWLHDHMYKNRATAALFVFATSAAAHEYILALALRFCYPVMFVQFAGLGAALAFARTGALSPDAGNVFLWLCLISGSGIQLAMYAAEFYARRNCPPLDASPLLDAFLPRSWYCLKT